MAKKIVCSACNSKEEYAYLVYNKKKYCSKCTIRMFITYGALPNDGSAVGGRLAIDLCTKSKTRIKKFFSNKDEANLERI